ncbi:rho-associated protein kinase 1 isoform X3 [Anthonomus grandis grandis]|uniref:rho-associated protein kinase 1 isoform X3 n=1 Tax=Anthonomus grandis grandis TaxID=2921223 RepID=UPI002165D7E6|nr:rho-associated protein kinase 1 isoform X3 [Anthonomus grandis grandis]
MSETDDTDDLLLIPPDLFLVQSEPEPPYYRIVDSLITQVSNLQERIEGIESMSDVSLVGSYIDLPFVETENNLRMLRSKNSTPRRYYSQDDLYQPSSTQSTPQKMQERIQINSLPNTPSINRYSPKKSNIKFSSPQQNCQLSKKQSEEVEVLHEIDTFISNVKTIQRNAVRNLQKDFGNIGSRKDPTVSDRTTSQSCDKDVRETLAQLDRQSERLVENGEPFRNELVEDRIEKVAAWQCGNNVNSVPDYGAGVRDLLYKTDQPKNLPIKPSYKQSHQPSSSVSTDLNTLTNTTLDKSTDSSSESTQLTAYNKFKRQEEEFNNKINKLRNTHIDTKLQDHYDNALRQNCPESGDKPDKQSNAISILNMHKKLTENDALKPAIPKKRGKNTLNDNLNLGLLNLADIWGTHIVESPGKVSQKLQEERMRRQHCEQLIQELQNRNLELQQKLVVAVKVDETKNDTIRQFKETLDNISDKFEKLNEEKASWDREVARLKSQFSVELESANQKATYYEKEASKSLNIAHANQDKIASLEKRCSELQQELTKIEQKFGDVQDSYNKEFERNKQLADIISQKELELRESKTILNNAKEEVTQSRKAVELCQIEFTSVKKECANLEADLRESTNTIINLTEQKKKLGAEIQMYKVNEKKLTEDLEQARQKVENTKLELRNFYQGQLELIVENKRKEMQSQLDKERQNCLEEIKKKELSMAKTAANHIKEISDKCGLEIKLLEQKHQEEIRLYQMQLSHANKELETLQNKLAHLPEKRAEIAKQLQKVMESQWNEALKMISSSPSPLSNDNGALSNMFSSKAYSNKPHKVLRKELDHDFDVMSDYDETPVSSRGPKQTESDIQKYINMLLDKPPGQPLAGSENPGVAQNQERASWHPGVRPRKNK